MESKNIDKVHQSFAVQAENFEGDVHAARQAYLEHSVEVIAPSKTDSVLEVAAGTCVCGREMAKYAAVVTCLDTTPEMLTVGKRNAGEMGLDNMVFVTGDAANLPFLDETYDISICRLAFHHILEPERPFSEMVRVTKKGGRVVVIDLEAAPESLRAVQDKLETLRDPSHAKTLSERELCSLFENAGLKILHSEKTKIEMTLDAWLDLTKTPDDIRTDITKRMLGELDGGAKTGFDPYIKDDMICFKQRWQMVIGSYMDS